MRNTLFFVIIFLSLSSCQKELVGIEDLNFSDAGLGFEIAISGFVSNEEAICQIKVSEPVSIKDSIQLLPLNNADIKLKTRDEIYSFHLSDENGIYLSDEKIKGQQGNIYSLEVTYNGKTYLASDTMPSIGQDSFKIPIYSLISNEEEDFMEYKLLEHNFGFQDPSIWLFTEGYENEYGQHIIPHFEINDFFNKRIYAHRGSIPQGLFPAGFEATGISGNRTDSLEVVKLNISERYYQYLLSVFNITDWNTGIFSTISGNTITNVSNGGVGYFYAVNTQRKRITYENCND